MGEIYVYTGEGAGKTTSALGLALRSIGHGHKVVIIQFMKGRKDIGEYKVREKLAPLYDIYQFGSEKFVDLKNPSEDDKKKAAEGLEFAGKKAAEAPDLLILDEINIAIHYGLLEKESVLSFLGKVPEKTVVVLTGRYAPKDILDKADFVNEINDVKHPLEDGIEAKEGIQY